MSLRTDTDISWEEEINKPRHIKDVRDIFIEADRKPSAVKSVYRAANIITCLGSGLNTITDIATYCKLNKATVHRLLKALIESRIAMQDPANHRYYLGYAVAQIVANPYATHEYLVTCASRPMNMLSDTTEETIILCISSGLQYIILREIPSKHGLRVVDGKKGDRFLHAGATSKVLLSQLNDKELKIALMNMDLEPLTSTTVTDKKKLMSELKRIQAQGYAVSYGERIKGGMCIAVPVTNYVLPVALGIVGPESRIKPRKADFIQELRIAAKQISENIEKAFLVLKAQS